MSPKLPVNLRGPTAYVLGNRMLQKQNPQAARNYFQAALADSEPNSVPRLRLTQAELDQAETEAEVAAFCNSVKRDSPFGSEDWTKATVGDLHLESSLRLTGRPKKEGEMGTSK